MKLLTYDNSPETLVWETILATIKSDPFLNDAGVKPRPPKIVSYLDGIAESEKAKPEPDIGELPYIRISHGGMISSNWVNNHQHQVYFRLSIGLYVEGDDPGDIFNLNHMIRQAIFPQDQTRRDLVFGNYNLIRGFSTPISDKSVGGLLVMGKSQHGLKAECGYRLGVEVNT